MSFEWPTSPAPGRESGISEIPEDEIVVTFARSGGKGGQNVNKVNSKAIARWHLESTSAFTEEQKERIRTRLPKKRMNEEGFVFVASEETRDQLQNRTAAMAKLRAIVAEALETETERKPTRPTRGSKERRLESKEKQSRKKADRKWSGEE